VGIHDKKRGDMVDVGEADANSNDLPNVKDEPRRELARGVRQHDP